MQLIYFLETTGAETSFWLWASYSQIIFLVTKEKDNMNIKTPQNSQKDNLLLYTASL